MEEQGVGGVGESSGGKLGPLSLNNNTRKKRIPELWCSHCGKVRQFLKKFNIGLSYHAAIPLLGIYPKGLKVGT